MKIKNRNLLALAWLALVATINSQPSTFAQGTAFTYQGRLNSGANAASGSYDLAFSLFATNTSGVAIAGPVTNASVAVSNGLFTTMVNFGNVFTGASNWLEIAISTNGANSFSTLAPRQPLTPAPYAITALNLAGVVANNTVNNGNYAVVGGGRYNTSSGFEAVVGGGSENLANGPNATIGGGFQNNSTGTYTTVGGGLGNNSAGDTTAVAGGEGNSASGSQTFIGGGFGNTASGYDTTIGGGEFNTVSGNYATVPGGDNNSAVADYTFAAGNQAQATNQGCFVWADSENKTFSSTAPDQFCIRAQGGVQISPNTSLNFGSQTRQMLNLWGTQYGTGVQAYTLYFRTDSTFPGGGFAWYQGGVHNDTKTNSGGGTTMMTLDNSGLRVNGTFVSSSDRNVKQDFAEVNSRAVLEKVARLPIQTWAYTNDPSVKHLGPVAQDFYTAFAIGADDRHIAVVDEGGVALAAIQGLNQKLKDKDVELQILKQQNESLAERLNVLETAVKLLAAHK